MCSFIESSPITAYEYSLWLNKKIYSSKNKPRNPSWAENWKELFENSNERWLFGSFLGTKVGQKWLETDLGKLYLKWQEEG